MTDLGRSATSAHRIHWHEETISPDVIVTWRGRRLPTRFEGWERVYVALDAALQALEEGYHPQNPSTDHPADYLRRRFEDEPTRPPLRGRSARRGGA